jgi:cyclic pyranopterin monophosphate synthase
MMGSTHFDADGNIRMVDVSEKDVTDRCATAKARVLMRSETLAMIAEGRAAKGDVLAVARLAGIMAAKRTADLIPLCHPIPLSAITIELACDEAAAAAVEVTATCRVRGRTGVEMEAMTAAAIASLTIYDMCKSVDRGMRIADLRLVYKAGGKSGSYMAP